MTISLSDGSILLNLGVGVIYRKLNSHKIDATFSIPEEVMVNIYSFVLAL
jgi:hypothetical protein